MEVRTDITPADVRAFHEFCARRMNRAMRSPWRPALIGFALMFPLAFVWRLAGLDLHLPSVIGALLFMSAFLWFHQRRLLSAAQNDDRGSTLGPKHVTLDESGVRQTDPRHTGSTRWEGVLNVEENDQHIFLMIDRYAGYIVPKRCFSTATEAAQFVRFARAHLTPAPPA